LLGWWPTIPDASACKVTWSYRASYWVVSWGLFRTRCMVSTLLNTLRWPLDDDVFEVTDWRRDFVFLTLPSSLRLYIVYMSKFGQKKTMTNLQHVWPSGLNTCIISFICCSFWEYKHITICMIHYWKQFLWDKSITD
jgi:hypothetical protein